MDTPLVTGETITYEKLMEAVRKLSEQDTRPIYTRDKLKPWRPNLVIYDDVEFNSVIDNKLQVYGGICESKPVPIGMDDVITARRHMLKLYETHPHLFKSPPVDLSKYKPPLIY